MDTIGCSAIHQIQRGGVRATVYENLLKGSRYIVSFGRLYQEEGQWKPATGYRMGDVIILCAVAMEVYFWLEDRIEKDRAIQQPAMNNIVAIGPRPVLPGKEGV